MKQQRSTSFEHTPGGTAPAVSPLPGNPTRLESAVVLGVLLIGLASCLMLYGRPMLAMLRLLGQALSGGQ